MKIIYDSEQPREKRIEFIGQDGKSYFGFHCFVINLDDGKELFEIGAWGNQRQRNAILKTVKTKAKMQPAKTVKKKDEGGKL